MKEEEREQEEGEKLRGRERRGNKKLKKREEMRKHENMGECQRGTFRAFYGPPKN